MTPTDKPTYCCEECGEPMDYEDVLYATITGFSGMCKGCYDNFHYGEEPGDE